MTHSIGRDAGGWMGLVVCCSRCGSADMCHRTTDKLYVCNRCGRESRGGLLSTNENRSLISQLRAAWGGSGREGAGRTGPGL
jgi:hypothetical protein